MIPAANPGDDTGRSMEQPLVLPPGLSLPEIVGIVRRNIRLLVLGPLVAGALAFGATYLVAPVFTAQTTFLPPQQAQSTAASALASLGALGGLAAGAAGIKSPAEQYVSLMQSVQVSDRIIDAFSLMSAYEERFRVDARKTLGKNVRISIGKKDGLITVEVDDVIPKRAAEMANSYVEELRRLTGALAMTEAQQRRSFFEKQLQQTREQLTEAQRALQASGFNPEALKAEPKAAVEAYARLKAELTGTEVRLSALRKSLTDEAPELRQLQAAAASLRAQMQQAASESPASNATDYIGRFREYKYQETLFELYARQFEIARADESREASLIQVIDVAQSPEKKSRPKRSFIAALAAICTGLVLLGYVVVREKNR